MKLMIASDLHGSAYFTRKLMERYDRERPDKLLLLGDLLYHGPRNALPQDYSCPDVASQLNAVKDRIVAVRGNCDCEVDQMVLEFPMMGDYALLEINGLSLYATHGHMWSEACPPVWPPAISSSPAIPMCRPASPTGPTPISIPAPSPSPRAAACAAT